VRGQATETQVCYLTAAEARLIISKYRSVPDVPASPPAPRTPLMGADQEMSLGHGDNVPADPLSELITLRAAVEERGLAPWKYAAAKKRLQRARAAGSPAAPT